MKELPLIACSLPANARGTRVEEWRALADSAIASSRTAVGFVLRFRTSDVARARELAAAEAECCPFITFEFNEEGDETAMMVRAPIEAAPLLHELLA